MKHCPLTHEQFAAIYCGLAAFAEKYPSLCEGDKRWYRDMAGAALMALRDGEACEDLTLGPAVEQVMNQVVRNRAVEGIGRRVLALAAEAGVTLYLRDGGGYAGPAARVTEGLRRTLTACREDVIAALSEQEAERLVG